MKRLGVSIGGSLGTEVCCAPSASLLGGSILGFGGVGSQRRGRGSLGFAAGGGGRGLCGGRG